MSKVVIYTKQTCSWCDRLKGWLKENAIDFKEVDIEKDREALEFIKSQNLTTVPQVFIDGIHRPHEPIYSGLLEWIKNDSKMPADMKVIKRDGTSVSFEGEKIEQAVLKANNETKELSPEEVNRVAQTVVDKIAKNIIEVEEIQDLVEIELMNQQFPKTA